MWKSSRLYTSTTLPRLRDTQTSRLRLQKSLSLRSIHWPTRCKRLQAKREPVSKHREAQKKSKLKSLSVTTFSILGLYWDNGKSNGNYYRYIGIVENKMETFGLSPLCRLKPCSSWGCLGIFSWTISHALGHSLACGCKSAKWSLSSCLKTKFGEMRPLTG